MQERLAATPGRHLVIVHYAPGHSPHQEWVHNEADIDGAKVVWAHAMGEEPDRELKEYFADRRLWDLYADREPPQLVEEPRGSRAPAAGPDVAPG
jgi:hypothetical protein